MRTRLARLLRSLADRVEPPFRFSPDILAVIERHNLDADELGPGFEVGYRYVQSLNSPSSAFRRFGDATKDG